MPLRSQDQFAAKFAETRRETVVGRIRQIIRQVQQSLGTVIERTVETGAGNAVEPQALAIIVKGSLRRARTS